MPSPSLSPRSFEKLLAFLAPDREAAGSRYEAIRRRLVKFFECRGCPRPEDLADEAIDRVARKVDEGGAVAPSPEAYFYGVAHNLEREAWRGRGRERALEARLLRGPRTQVAAAADELAGVRLTCLDSCLEHLSSDDRQLILWYYRVNDEGAMIEARKELASQLAIPLNALRIRAHRIRTRLEACVEGCVGRPAGAAAEPGRARPHSRAGNTP